MEFITGLSHFFSSAWTCLHLTSLIIALGGGAFAFLSLKKKTNLSMIMIVAQAFLLTLFLYFFLVLITPKKVPAPSENNINSTLIIGTSADFPPFSFLQDNEIVGFDADIAREVAKRLGKEISFKNMPFDTLIPELQLGKVHALAAGLTATPERAARVLFTKPYLQGIPLIAISLSKNKPIQSIADLTGKAVVVNTGYTADSYMSKISGPILQHLPTPAEAFLAVKTGRADAFVTAQNTVKPFLNKQAENEFSIFIIPDTDENNVLAISKKYPELLPHIQKALDDMGTDGTIDSLIKKWNIA